MEKRPFSRKQIKINEFYTENRLFLAILTQSYIWQEDSWNFYFLAKMALFCPNKLPRSVSLSGMVFLYSWAGPFWTPESCATGQICTKEAQFYSQAKFEPKWLNFNQRPYLNQTSSISSTSPIWAKVAKFHYSPNLRQFLQKFFLKRSEGLTFSLKDIKFLKLW